MMIIIFMLITAIVPEHFIKPLGRRPLCENMSEFPSYTMETCTCSKFIPTPPPPPLR